MIIVDTALRRARGRGPPDPGRHDRRRLHGPRPREPDRQLHPGHGAGRGREPHLGQRRAGLRRGRRRRRSSGRATPARLEARSPPGVPAVTEDPFDLLRAPSRSTRSSTSPAPSSSAPAVTLAAIEHGKHVVLMNAELDGTLGPLLEHRAPTRPASCSPAADGDQPGVQVNLLPLRQGARPAPLVVGNIKGLQDPYRTPTTQKGFAEQLGPEPVHGHQLRRRHQGLVRAGDRRQRDRHDRGRSAACSAATTTGHVDELTDASTTSTSCASWAASSTTSSAPSPAPASSSSARTTTRSSATT